MPSLKHDIVGCFPPRRKYGAKDDAVEIISLHGHVFIVEGSGGYRFSVIADDLVGIPPPMEACARAAQAEISQSRPPPPKMPTKEIPPSPTPSPRKRTQASAAAPKPDQNQGRLF